MIKQDTDTRGRFYCAIIKHTRTVPLSPKNINTTEPSPCAPCAPWNAVATQSIGQKTTRLFANAHEFGWVWENFTNPMPMEMDLHNNAVGRNVGSSTLYKDDIKTAISSKQISGKLKKIYNGRLVFTNANAQIRSK